METTSPLPRCIIIKRLIIFLMRLHFHKFPLRGIAIRLLARRSMRWQLPLILWMLPLLLAAQGQDGILVSNTAQTHTEAFTGEHATQFTTGTLWPNGYAISSVDIQVRNTSGKSTVVTIRQNSSGNPGAVVATLTNPGTFTANALNTFTAPANTVLANSTSYFLVVNDGRSSSTSSNIEFSLTSSDSQTGDVHIVTAWSIGDAGRQKSGSSWSSQNNSLRFAVKGYPILPIYGITASMIAGTEGSTTDNFTFSKVSGPTLDEVLLRYNVTETGDMLTANFDRTLIEQSTGMDERYVLSITYNDDNVDEPDSRITCRLLSKDFSDVDDHWVDQTQSSITFTVRDDDPTIVSLARSGTGGIDEGETAEFTVILGRSLVAGDTIDVPLSIGGTGVTTGDWSLTLKTGTDLNTNTGVVLSGENTATPQITLAGAGADTATLVLTAIRDSQGSENAETFTVALGPNGTGTNGFDRESLDTNVGGGADPSGTANNFEVVVTNVAPVTVSFTSSAVIAMEGETADLTVQLSEARSTNTSMRIFTIGTSASENSDYIPGPFMFTIPAGQTKEVLSISLLEEIFDERPETFNVIISDVSLPAGVVLGSQTELVITILDNDPTVVSLARTGMGAIAEGDTIALTVTLSLELVAGDTIDVPLSVGGTGVTTDDWSLALKTGNSLNTGVTLIGEDTTMPQVRFAGAGAKTAMLELIPPDDDALEGMETFTIALGPNGIGANGFDRESLDTNVGGGADPSTSANSFNVEVNDPPAKPTGFTAAAGDREVTLSWTDPNNGIITGYEFQQKTGSDGFGDDWTDITGSDATTTTHTVSGLTNGTAYTLRIRAVAGTVVGAPSDEVTTTPSPPGITFIPPADATVAEGDAASTSTLTLRLDTRPADAVTVVVTAPAGLEVDGPADGASFNSSVTVSIPPGEWNTSQRLTVRAIDDNTDNAGVRALAVTYAATSPDGDYNNLSGTAATITVSDDDATSVTLAGAVGDLTEGDAKMFMVTLGRSLINGEVLAVPLTFGGMATRGTDYMIACANTLPDGVTCNDLNTDSAPTVTFTGPPTGMTAVSVTLTLTAATDGDMEVGGETVDIGLGTLDANSGTNLGGGAVGTDNVAAFRISDPALPPAKPAGFTATAGSKQVTLNWTDPKNGAITSYQFQQKEGGDYGEWMVIANSDATTTTQAVSGLTNGTAYTFRIRAVIGSMTSVPSDEAMATPVNTAPTVMSMIPDQNATVGTAFNYQFPENTFSDADGDPLTYAATRGDDSALPTWLTFDDATRTFSGTPQAGNEGTLSIKVTADDENGDTVFDSFDITVNAMPVVTIAAGTSPVTEGTDAVFTVTAAPAPAADLTVNLSVAEAAGSDFVVSGDEGMKMVIIPASGSATYTVATVSDDTEEPNGSVTVTVTNSSDYATGTPSEATVTVNDDDEALLGALEDEGETVIVPNPSDSYIEVRSTGTSGAIGEVFKILSLSGKPLLEGTTNTKMDISSLRSGLYLVQLPDGRLLKFVKE